MDDDWFPRHPRLRPGVRVVRRDDGRQQVGLRPDERVILPDHPDVPKFLAALAAGRRPDLRSPGPRRWAELLAARGLVVDAHDVAAAMASGLPRPCVAAAYARHGAETRLRLDARREARIAVRADDHLTEHSAELLAEVGLAAARGRESPTAALVVSASGEVPRPALEEWVRAGVPHLVVSNLAGRVTLGPFVAPGITACLGCLDAHGSDRDPGHGLVVEQHGPLEGEPADPLLLRIGLTWAVRDLVSYVEGDLPSTWSATVALDGDLRAERTAWTRHPRCGCAWGDVLAAG